MIELAGYKGVESTVYSTVFPERGTAVMNWVQDATYNSYHQLKGDVETIARLVKSREIPPSVAMLTTLQCLKRERAVLTTNAGGTEEDLEELVVAELELDRLTIAGAWVAFRVKQSSLDHKMSRKRKRKRNAEADSDLTL